MNNITTIYYKATVALFLFFTSTMAYAQIDIDIDLGKQEWYENPKVWIGVAVFLLILVIISRVGKSKS